MQKHMKHSWRLAAGLFLAAAWIAQTQMMHMPEKVGHVVLQTSCSTMAQASLNRGISLLYSFWYDEAEKSFLQAVGADPQCAMAYWGEAMSKYQPVEGLPEGLQLQAGQQAIAKALVAHEQSPREHGYVAALAIIFDTSKLPKAQSRAENYSSAMGEVSAAYSNDTVATTRYARSLLSPVLPDDPNHDRNRKALSILNGVLVREPDNPGVMHFIIHASDNPQMASYGLDAARRYARIAPASAHALHMPGHIFARLGLWQDDIRSNLASEAAAENHTNSMHIGAQNRLHALEFLEYAYLQIGREDKAEAIVQKAAAIKASELDPGFEGYYGWVEVSFPIRLDLETHNWPAALMLAPPQEAGPYVLRALYWAHAVAAGHLRDKSAAEQALIRYEQTFTVVELAEEEHNLSTQLMEVRAWALFAKGDWNAAVVLLRPVADRQDKLGKGEVELPAREMLGDILRLSNKTAESLTEYRVSLRTDPGRFNTLLHATEMARKLGRRQEANTYFALLLKNARDPAPASKKAMQAVQPF